MIGFGVVTTLYFIKAPVSGLLYGFIGFSVCFIAGSIASLLFPNDKPKRP